MVREFPGFAGVGFMLILFGTVAAGFILGLLVLIPVAIRIRPAENRDRRADRSVLFLGSATLFSPVYLALAFILFDLFGNSSFLHSLGVAIFLPAPIVTLALATIGLFLALRGPFFILKLGAGFLSAYFVLEFLLIVGAIVPSIGSSSATPERIRTT